MIQSQNFLSVSKHLNLYSTKATAKFAHDLTESYSHVTPGEQRFILMVNRDLGCSTNGYK